MSDVLDNFFIEPNVIASKLSFLGSPLPIWFLTIAYLSFVLKIGPAFMRQREEGYNLKRVLSVYNLTKAVLNFRVCFLIISLMLYCGKTISNWSCATSLTENHVLKTMELELTYFFYILKILDYFDTVLLVLRKKLEQITFLHVYERVFLANFMYFYLHFYGAGGQLIFAVLLNCLGQFCTYIYYFLRPTHTQTKSTLSWKKYAKHLQLIEFILSFLYNGYLTVYRTECSIPNLCLIFGLSQIIIMCFYIKQAYLSKSIKSKSNDNSNNIEPNSVTNNHKNK